MGDAVGWTDLIGNGTLRFVARYSKARDGRVTGMPESGVAETVDEQTRSVAAAVKAALRQRFGSRLAEVFVFGSRARGDHRADSDLDVAVLLHDTAIPLSRVDRELLDVTYPVEIESGIHIQAWALPAAGLDAGASGFRARLVSTIRREGVRL